MERIINNTLFAIDDQLDELHLSIIDNDFTTNSKNILFGLSSIELNISKIRKALIDKK